MKKGILVVMLFLMAVTLIAEEMQDCYQVAEQKAKQIITEQKRLQQSVDTLAVKVKWEFVSRQFKSNQELDDLIRFNAEMGHKKIKLGKIEVGYNRYGYDKRQVFGFKSDPNEQKVDKYNFKRFIALSKLDTTDFLINVSKQHKALMHKVEKARKNWQFLHDYLTEKNLLNYISVNYFFLTDKDISISCNDSVLCICNFKSPPTLKTALKIMKRFSSRYFQGLVGWNDYTAFKEQLEKEVCEFLAEK
ncbi:hypothetical protein ACFL1Y_00620 [Patescibacteria group bacterium]